MKYDPNIHNRQSIRLKNFNYSLSSAYFVTICSQNRECIFGNVLNGTVNRSVYGDIALLEWKKLIERWPNLILDEFVVMPNHLHGILWLPVKESVTLGEIVGAYKSLVFNKSLKLAKQQNQNLGFFWQRNFWEHIVRNDKELNILREYIQNNPLKWELDSLFNSMPDSRATARVAPTERSGV